MTEKLSDADINFTAPETGRESIANKPETTAHAVSQMVLAEKLPDAQSATMSIMNHPDLNALGNAVERVIYPKLVERKIKASKETQNQLFDSKRQFAQEFVDLTKNTGFPVGWSREKGKSGYHFNNTSGEKSISDGFAYFFNKSRSEWKPYQGEVQRAYLTIQPESVRDIPKHFVELTQFFNEAGIDYYAKAASPWQASTRNDNMVFYISPNDKDRAHELFRDYIAGQKIFSGEVLSAEKDENTDGLSWGVEPNQEDVENWQAATRDPSSAISYSQSLALEIAPTVFNAIAKKHYEQGNQQEFTNFRQLAIESADAITEE